MATTSLIPIPPASVPLFDPATGQIDPLWQNYFLALETLGGVVPPLDARYWVGTSDTDLTNEQNIGALATGYLKIVTTIGVATPSTTTTIPAADIAAGTAGISISGNAATATKLATARTVNGVSFDGTADIVVNGTFTAYGAGTAYVLTNTAAAIDFGTTDPTITITTAGTYMLWGQVVLAYNGATVVAETATVKMRRTNNTAADVGQVVVIDLPVATTSTYTYGVVALPPTVYVTTNVDDIVKLFGNVSAALGAGTIDATAVGTSLVAMRIA